MAQPSEASQDIIEVAEHERTAYIRIRGRATFMLANDFRDYVKGQIETGRGVLIDLSECTTLDSTFVGMITSLTLKYREQDGSCIKLFNISSHVREILQTLGLLDILDTVRSDRDNGLAFAAISHELHTKINIAKLMLDAHKALARINDDNALEFKNVINYLEKQVK